MAYIVPDLPRPERRELVRLGKKSSNPNTATRFLIIARLAAPERPSKTRVARELEVEHLSLPEYIDWVVGNALKFEEVALRITGETAEEKAQSLIDELIRTALTFVE